MNRVFISALLISLSFHAFSQKKIKPQKPQVLVYGHAADAFAAAVQACQSGVETLWVIDSTAIGGSLIQGNSKTITSNYKLDAGIWAVLLKGIANANKVSDSASTAAKRHLSPRIAQNVLEQFSDTVKRLQIRKNMRVTALEKSGKNWEVRLSNHEKFKVAAVVDASDKSSLYTFVVPESQSERSVIKKLDPLDYTHELFRTGVAVSDLGGKAFNIPWTYISPNSLTNYFATRSLSRAIGLTYSDQQIPFLMLQAQACGAAAAYCAFFKTTGDKINVRTLQGEILAFKGELIPFQDITLDDPHFASIQRVGATGVLKGHYQTTGKRQLFLFHPDSSVASKEIESVMKALYTRSQIWFKDKDISTLHLADVIDLIKYVALRGEELNAEVEKGWQKRLHFKGSYDLNKPVTRRQFAVLLDTYLQPFSVRVTSEGAFQY